MTKNGKNRQAKIIQWDLTSYDIVSKNTKKKDYKLKILSLIKYKINVKRFIITFLLDFF